MDNSNVTPEENKELVEDDRWKRKGGVHKKSVKQKRRQASNKLSQINPEDEESLIELEEQLRSE